MVVKDFPVKTIDEILCNMLGSKVKRKTVLNGGRNSRVLKVQTEDDRLFVTKQYFLSPYDHRDRMTTELKAIRLLQAHNVDCIPCLVADDRQARVAVLDYIPGTPVEPICRFHIDQAISFLKKLRTIGLQIGSPSTLPRASEAFFSANQIAGNIKERFAILQNTPHTHLPGHALDEFLQNDVRPELNLAVDHCAGIFQHNDLSMADSIGPEKRTLSPSDFGFHNAVEREDGKLFFLDFEYFGWDDPAKLICDFILHPGMGLTDVMKAYFCQKALVMFEGGRSLSVRIMAFYPLFLLKWCLIILNEFLYWEQARRLFAYGKDTLYNDTLLKQLNLAKTFFSERKLNYEKLCAYISQSVHGRGA